MSQILVCKEVLYIVQGHTTAIMGSVQGPVGGPVQGPVHHVVGRGQATGPRRHRRLCFPSPGSGGRKLWHAGPSLGKPPQPHHHRPGPWPWGGSLTIRLPVIHLPPPWWEELLYGVEERWVGWQTYIEELLVYIEPLSYLVGAVKTDVVPDDDIDGRRLCWNRILLLTVSSILSHCVYSKQWGCAF